MKAVIFHGKDDIRIEEWDKPICGENEVLVKMEACAVCGTDMKAFYHGNPRMQPPRIMGHEFCGLIEECGANVDGFENGERVVMATSISCGECFYCKKGHTNLCANIKPMGFYFDGGMAEYIIIPELAIKRGHLIKVPLDVEPNIACIAEPLSCAINSLQNVGIEEGDTVLVMGAGPLGILNLSVAKELGASKTILAEVSDERLKIAESFKVDRLVNSAKEDLHAIIMEMTDGIGVDRVIVTAPAAAPQEQALSLVRKQGSVCLFASLPEDSKYLKIDSRLIHYGEIKLVGTSDSTPAQVKKAVEIIGRESFPAEKIATHTLPLERIKDSFQLMKDGVALRVVLTS